MSARRVINRKTITISQDLSTATVGAFKKNVSLHFTPDEMIVKLISFTTNADPTTKKNGSVLIKCSTINEDLGSIYDGVAYCPNFIFLAKNFPINTEWHFQLTDANNVADGTFNVGELYIHVEFVQYG